MKFILLLVVLTLGTQSSFSQGLKVIDMQSGSLYEKLGLKQGDTITSYNGKPVSSVEDSMELYNQIKKGGDFELEIKRNGKIKKMKYSIQ